MTEASTPLATLVPPVRALKGATAVVALIGTVGVVAWLVGGSGAVVAVLLGAAALSGIALAAPALPWGLAGAVIVGASAGAGAAVAGRSLALAALVAAAALALGPFTARFGAVAGMIPALPAIFGLDHIDQAWYTIAFWATVGAASALVLRRMFRITVHGTPVHRATAAWYAVIVAVSAAALTAVSASWPVPHGYWAVIALCLVIQPVRGETTSRAIDRILGTASGAVLAGVLALVLPAAATHVAAAGCAVLMLGWALAGHPRRQIIYLTPVVVLLASADMPSSALDLAAERVALSAAGAVIAVLIALAVRLYGARRS